MIELAVCVGIFLDLFGWGMVLPEVQFKSERLGAPGWMIGVILMSTFLMQMLTSPHWGRLSDRIGRKPVLVATTLLSATGLAIYGFSSTLWLILLSRTLSGLGGANVAAAQATLADLSTEEQRSQAMGRLGACVSAGLIAGPSLGAILLVTFKEVPLGLIAGISSLVGALVMLAAVPYQRGDVPTEESESKRGGWRLLREVPELRRLFNVCATAWLALAILEGTFGRLLERKFHQGAATFSGIFAYESILGVVIQAVILGWITAKLRGPIILRIGLALAGIGLTLTPFAPSVPIIIIASTIYAFGAGISNPTLNAEASKRTPAGRQGELFGIFQSARSVGFLIGPVVGGLLFDHWPAGPYVTAGLACVAACLMVPDFKAHGNSRDPLSQPSV